MKVPHNDRVMASAHHFVPKKLRLSVWGMDARGQAFVETMPTVQIAAHAVEVDCKRQLAIGEIVGAGLGGMKSRFRIVSSFISGKDTFRVQMEDLGSSCMWEKELASPDAAAEARTERRRHMRWPARGTVLIHNRDRTTSAQARLVDISERGCYVETLAPAQRDTELEITLKSEGISIELKVKVCTSHPSIGMGAEITEFGSEADEQRFARLLETSERAVQG